MGLAFASLWDMHPVLGHKRKDAGYFDDSASPRLEIIGSCASNSSSTNDCSVHSSQKVSVFESGYCCSLEDVNNGDVRDPTSITEGSPQRLVLVSQEENNVKTDDPLCEASDMNESQILSQEEGYDSEGTVIKRKLSELRTRFFSVDGSTCEPIENTGCRTQHGSTQGSPFSDLLTVSSFSLAAETHLSYECKHPRNTAARDSETVPLLMTPIKSHSQGNNSVVRHSTSPESDGGERAISAPGARTPRNTVDRSLEHNADCHTPEPPLVPSIRLQKHRKSVNPTKSIKEQLPDTSPSPFLHRFVRSAAYVTDPSQVASPLNAKQSPSFDVISVIEVVLEHLGPLNMLARFSAQLSIILPIRSQVVDTVRLNIVATNLRWCQDTLRIETKNGIVLPPNVLISEYDQGDTTAKIITITAPKPLLEKPLFIQGAVPYSLEQGHITIKLPSFRPAMGNLLAERYYVYEPCPPLTLGSTSDQAHWQLLHNSNLGSYLFLDRGNTGGETLLMENANEATLDVTELQYLRIDKSQDMTGPTPLAWGLKMSIDTVPGVVVLCRVKLNVTIGQGGQLLAMDSSHWALSSFLLNERPPNSPTSVWIQHEDGLLVLPKQIGMQEGDSLKVEMHWEMPWIDLEMNHSDIFGIQLPSVRSHRVVGGRVVCPFAPGKTLLELQSPVPGQAIYGPAIIVTLDVSHEGKTDTIEVQASRLLPVLSIGTLLHIIMPDIAPRLPTEGQWARSRPDTPKADPPISDPVTYATTNYGTIEPLPSPDPSEYHSVKSTMTSGHTGADPEQNDSSPMRRCFPCKRLVAQCVTLLAVFGLILVLVGLVYLVVWSLIPPYSNLPEKATHVEYNIITSAVIGPDKIADQAAGLSTAMIKTIPGQVDGSFELLEQRQPEEITPSSLRDKADRALGWLLLAN